MRPIFLLLFCIACEPDTSPKVLQYSEVCNHELPSKIRNTTGTFKVKGQEDVPAKWGVGTSLGLTGSLVVVACSPSVTDEILDDVVLEIELVLFEVDEPIDLDIHLDATMATEDIDINVLWGTVTDWGEVVAWDEDETFMHFTRGTSSWSVLSKADGGELVGTIDVTETDPPGYQMTVDIDLNW